MKYQKIGILFSILVVVSLLASCGTAPTDVVEEMVSTPQPESTQPATAEPTEVPVVPVEYQCVAGEEIVIPDDPGYIDIRQIETSLEGEQLTVVLYLRDMPETLSINREGVETGYTELWYEIDITQSGEEEPEYAMALVENKSGDPQAVNFEDAFTKKPVISQLDSEGNYNAIGEGEFSIDRAAKTITLVGDFAGITTESVLSFFTYANSGQSSHWDVACIDRYYADQPCLPNQVIDPGEKAPITEIKKIESSLNGEELTVTFHVQDIPEEITVNRENVLFVMEVDSWGNEHPLQGYDYLWSVAIDVDNDESTGPDGNEFNLFLGRAKDSEQLISGSFEELLSDYVSLEKLIDDERYEDLAATLVVDPETKSFSLVATVPGITEESHLEYHAYDYLYLMDQLKLCRRK